MYAVTFLQSLLHKSGLFFSFFFCGNNSASLCNSNIKFATGCKHTWVYFYRYTLLFAFTVLLSWANINSLLPGMWLEECLKCGWTGSRSLFDNAAWMACSVVNWFSGKLSKIGAARCQILGLKCATFNFCRCWGSLHLAEFRPKGAYFWGGGEGSGWLTPSN